MVEWFGGEVYLVAFNCRRMDYVFDTIIFLYFITPKITFNVSCAEQTKRDLLTRLLKTPSKCTKI
jgi:hypothetical protein